jgi:hypothetical protein
MQFAYKSKSLSVEPYTAMEQAMEQQERLTLHEGLTLPSPTMGIATLAIHPCLHPGQ